MKKNISVLILSILSLGMLMSGCNSKSYYSANNKNLQKFDGWQLETANHLVEINDLEMLIVNMSELATESSVKKEIYLAAKEIDDRFSNLRLDTKMEAALQRATLSTSLSAESDKYYHRLVNTPKEEFDERYKILILEKLNELNTKISKYLDKGHSDRIKTLDKKIQKIASEHIAQLNGENISQL